MPIYETTLPDGQPLQVIGPPDATPQEISQAALQIASQQTPPPSTVTPNYTLGRAITGGFNTGVERVKSTFGDVIPAMAANALGFEDYAKQQMEEARRSEEKIARKYAPEFESFKDVDSLGGASRFVAGTIAEQGPNLLTMIGSGGVPGIAAKLTAKKFALDLAKKYPKMSTREIIQRVAKREGLAQNVGVFLGSYSLNAPEVFNNVYQETGQLETGTALLFGAAAASLDSVLPATILKKLTPLQKTEIAGAALLKSGANPSLVNKVFTGLAKGAATEGVTEGMQEAISISAENFVAGNPQIFGSEDWDRVMESSVRGAIAGGFFRGVSSPFEGRESESLLNTLDKPVITPVLDTGDVAGINAPPAKDPTAAINKGAQIGKDIAQGSQGDLFDGAKANIDPVTQAEANIDPATQTEEAMAIESDLAYQAAELGLEIQDNPNVGTRSEFIDPQNEAAGEQEVTYKIINNNWERQDAPTISNADAKLGTLAGGDQVSDGSESSQDAVNFGETNTGEVGVDTNIDSTVGGGENVSNVALDENSDQQLYPTLFNEYEKNKINNETFNEYFTRTKKEKVDPIIKETVEEAWESMSVSGIPFAELSAENQQRMTEAKEDGELTGQLVDQIDGELGFQDSRTETRDTGETAESVTTELVQEFGNNVNDTIERGKLVIVDDVSQLPANIKMSSTANGAYDSKSQTSYIVANRIEKGQGRRILLHEIGEHYGLEKMVGKDYMPLLNRLKTLRKQNPEVQAIFDEVQELYPELEVDSKPFLQEVMAKVGERAPNNSLFRRMVGAVKNFLRRLGLYDVNKFSDTDIQDMILNSLRVSLAEATGTREQASDTPAVQMSKNVEAKAELDVKRIMKIVGSNMYAEGDSPAVTVKELLQNAADSLKSLLAKGTIEKGNIEITIGRPFIFKDYGNENRVVSVKDSGKGMTPKTLSTTFITLGGSDKDPDASGGFGVAKAQFLFGNEGINVVTMNDGVISELISTGEALNKSVEEGIPLPEGTIMAYSPEEYNKIIIKREEARTKKDYRLSNQELNDDSLQPYMRLFPEGRGTIVEVKIPETYDSPDTQATEEIDIGEFLSSYPELSESPLFSTSPDGNTIKKSNIEVLFQGFSDSAELVPIGANFPSEDFATNIDVEFPWGTAKIIVSKEEVAYPNYYEKNIVVLSNGLFQFESELRVNPKDRRGDLIQRKFYIDIKSKIQPGEKGYPFANNRQSLIPEAERDLELMKSYLQKEFGQLELTNQYNSIVNTKFQILKKQKDGSVIAEDIPSLAKTEEKNAQAVIETKQDLEVTKAGKLIDKKTRVPVLTAKDIAEVQVSAEGLQVEKGIIPTDQVIIHDNLETSLRI